MRVRLDMRVSLCMRARVCMWVYFVRVPPLRRVRQPTSEQARVALGEGLRACPALLGNAQKKTPAPILSVSTTESSIRICVGLG
jgi:hypothetical protein